MYGKLLQLAIISGTPAEASTLKLNNASLILSVFEEKASQQSGVTLQICAAPKA